MALLFADLAVDGDLKVFWEEGGEETGMLGSEFSETLKISEEEVDFDRAWRGVVVIVAVVVVFLGVAIVRVSQGRRGIEFQF